MSEKTILTITLEDLKILLQEQSKLTGEAVVRSYKENIINFEMSYIRNAIREAQYPNDVIILEKYLKDK